MFYEQIYILINKFLQIIITKNFSMAMKSRLISFLVTLTYLKMSLQIQN